MTPPTKISTPWIELAPILGNDRNSQMNQPFGASPWIQQKQANGRQPMGPAQKWLKIRQNEKWAKMPKNRPEICNFSKDGYSCEQVTMGPAQNRAGQSQWGRVNKKPSRLKRQLKVRRNSRNLYHDFFLERLNKQPQKQPEKG
jgi:hypothetical protein